MIHDNSLGGEYTPRAKEIARLPVKREGFLRRIFQRKKPETPVPVAPPPDTAILAPNAYETMDTPLQGEMIDAYYGKLIDTVTAHQERASPSAHVANELLLSILQAHAWHLRHPEVPGMSTSVYVRHHGFPSPETLRPDLEAIAKRTDAPDEVRGVATMLASELAPLTSRPEIVYRTIDLDAWETELANHQNLTSEAQLFVKENETRDRFMLRLRESWYEQGIDATSRQCPVLYRDIEAQYHLVWNALLGGVKIECKKGDIKETNITSLERLSTTSAVATTPASSAAIVIKREINEKTHIYPIFKAPILLKYYQPIILDGVARDPRTQAEMLTTGTLLRQQLVRELHSSLRTVYPSGVVQLNEKTFQEAAYPSTISVDTYGYHPFDIENAVTVNMDDQKATDISKRTDDQKTRLRLKVYQLTDRKWKEDGGTYVAWGAFDLIPRYDFKDTEMVETLWVGLYGPGIGDVDMIEHLATQLHPQRLIDKLTAQYRGVWPKKE